MISENKRRIEALVETRAFMNRWWEAYYRPERRLRTYFPPEANNLRNKMNAAAWVNGMFVGPSWANTWL